MRRFHSTVLAMLATGLLAAFAATAGVAGAANTASAAAKAQAPGTIDVQFAVQSFTPVSGKDLVAHGQAIASYASADQTYVTRTPFTSTVKGLKVHGKATRTTQAANRICNVLSLNLAPIHLALLGLIVDLDRVNLTIKADSNGGLLGSLLCGLSGQNTTLQTAATQLTQAAQTSGLATGTGFEVPISSAAQATPQALPPVGNGICTVLDLPVGPLDLNLLGLIVHLDRTELRITADPNGGLLGSLLCSISGGPTPTVTPLIPKH